MPCHRSPAIPSLAWSSRDAVRVGTRLQRAGYRVDFLTSSVDRDDLLSALDAISEQADPDDTVLVYFSGHGVLQEQAGQVRRHLVFSDTKLDRLPTTALAAAELERRLARMDVTDKVLIQDTCYAAGTESGGKSLVRTRPGVKQLALPDHGPAPTAGEQRMYASQFYEQAIELPELRGSVYTHHWLDALDDPLADLDGDGCVGTLEAHIAAAQSTEAERDGFQHPQLQAGSPSNLNLGCTGEPTRAVLLDAGPTVVDPGRHVIETRTSRGPYRGSLTVQAGDWIEVPVVARSRSAYGMVGVHGGLDDLGSGPSPSVSASAWWAATDRGAGRPVVGAVVAHLPRIPSARACQAFTGTTALARAGWWGGSSVAIGPYGELGGGVRTPYDACTGEIVPNSSAAVLFGAGAHGHVDLGPVAITADAGPRFFPIRSGDRTHLHPALSADLGLVLTF